MCGLPFAGKTTIARSIAEHNGLQYISVDVINTERRLGLDGKAIQTHEWTRTYDEAYRKVEQVLSARQSVVFDDTNFLRSQRDHLLTIASRCEADRYVLYVTTSEAEVHRRWLANRIVGHRGDVRDEDFELVIRQFEPPTPDERVILCDSPLELDTQAGNPSHLRVH